MKQAPPPTEAEINRLVRNLAISIGSLLLLLILLSLVAIQ
jgi:hypothetical protein